MRIFATVAYNEPIITCMYDAIKSIKKKIILQQTCFFQCFQVLDLAATILATNYPARLIFAGGELQGGFGGLQSLS